MPHANGNAQINVSGNQMPNATSNQQTNPEGAITRPNIMIGLAKDRMSSILEQEDKLLTWDF